MLLTNSGVGGSVVWCGVVCGGCGSAITTEGGRQRREEQIDDDDDDDWTNKSGMTPDGQSPLTLVMCIIRPPALLAERN